MAQIETLVADIYALIERGHVADDASVEALGQKIAGIIKGRLAEAALPDREFTLRMSNLGRDDRQLWYDAHHKGEPEKLTAPARIKFLFGDILEALLLFLAKEAGHKVENEQKEIEVDGVKGHMDCTIDGVVTDAKSASTIAFQKFADGSLRHKDDFGYMWQVAGYHEAQPSDGGAFLVIDKTLGNICLMRVLEDEFKWFKVPQRITDLRAVIAAPEPPERCHDPVPDGKSGNMKLGTGCSYCKHKNECWPNLQTYIYSTGPRYLVTVKREPKVDKDV